VAGYPAGERAYGPSRIDLPTRLRKEIDLWISGFVQLSAREIRKETGRDKGGLMAG
jgi:hypothetical protein